ncbi:MAG TPA: hypothetical protein VF432_07860 [Thermoanaerobaculia bacterium]
MTRLTHFRHAATLLITIVAGGGVALADDAAISAIPFVMTLPSGYGEFTRQVQTVPSPEGDIETTTWISKALSTEAVVVTMSTMPAKILDPQKLITSTRASLLESLGATLESEQPRAGDVPSTRVLFRTDAAFFRARFTVVADRMYQLLYVGRSAEQRAAAPVAQMFESFRITGAGSD